MRWRYSVAAVLTAATLLFASSAPAAVRAQAPLRVCADPDYMPFSNHAGLGFENKIAQQVARDLGTTVQYTWASMRANGGYDQFIHDYLNTGKCDVVVNVPYASENVTATDPYYTSSYVFIYPKSKNYPITSLDSPVLKKLRIGFEADTPAQTGLQMRALILHATVFDIGDTEGASPVEMLDALKAGRIAVGITWEPAIGYYLQRRPDVAVVTVPNTRALGSPEQYAFPMAMGVKKGNIALANELNSVISKNKRKLTSILTQYGVKLYKADTDPG
jgi:mxaJ protein